MLLDEARNGDYQMVVEREARLRALFQVAFDGVIVSENGVVVEASQRLLDMSGYRLDEVVGRPLTDFVAREFHEILRQRQVAGTEGHLDAVAILKDGRPLQVEIFTRNHVRRGRVVRISALRDATEKRRLEEQARQAQKMEALGMLASGLAHDFNNVLTLVRSWTDILLQELDEPQRGNAMEILKATDLGAALTRQMLAYSRRQGVRPTSINVNVVVRESESLIRRLLGPAISLATELQRGVGTVRADSSQLQQVLLNLAVNARDAMPRGGTLVVTTRLVDLDAEQLRAHAPARPGRYVMLAVTDSGTGIPAEVKPRIFEPFFTTKEADRGTGLGLALVKDIVEQSRGFIVVDSTMSVGTTFAIYIPTESA